ncbi:MAG: MBL fold metallo-hydrolase [bacterium]
MKNKILILFFLLSSSAVFAESIFITPNVEVIRGAVNCVLLRENEGTLAVYGNPHGRAEKIEMLLFTHHRRDVTWSGISAVHNGAKAVAPENEREYFTDNVQFWNDYFQKRFHDYNQQTSKISLEPIPITQFVKQGDVFEWKSIKIKVLDTPGYTRGGVSYIFEKDGKRIACTGDLILRGGKILDLYSLQDRIEDSTPKTGGYHGYAARLAQVIQSLRKIKQVKPDVIIPARGEVIDSPEDDIDRLIENLQQVYSNYLSICALRWYWGDDYIRSCAARVLGTSDVAWMPMAETVHNEPPDWVIPIQNSRLIASSSGNAFMADCGSQSIIDKVRQMQKDQVIKAVEGLYITHYHDDHTNMAQKFADEFDCPIYYCPEMQDILEHPTRYRMPAMTDHPIRSGKVMPEKSMMRWHEFTFTFYYHPGQTLYHGGLLVEKDNGESMFFCGDSFTPSGIDDYCLLNRNVLDQEQGYIYCLNFLKTLPENCLITNQHVDEPFRFSAEQMDFMLNAYSKRIELLSTLFPWDNPNYGTDEQWARLYPYGTTAKAGEQVRLQIIITNYSPQEKEFAAFIHTPEGWNAEVREIRMILKPKETGSMEIPVHIPSEEQAGTRVVTADLTFDAWELRHWVEALIQVE